MGQKTVYTTTDLLTEIIRQGAETHCLTVEGIPWDARLVRIVLDYSVGYEVSQARLALVYESAEWPDAPEGSILPEQRIVFEAIRNDR